MDMTISRTVFSRRRNIAPPRRPRAEEAISNADLESYHLAQMKMQPGGNVVPEMHRPIHPICPACVVNSQAAIHRNYLALESHNCFLLKTMDNYNPFYVRLMPQAFHYLRLPNPIDKTKVVTPAEVNAVAHSMIDDGLFYDMVPTDKLDKTIQFASLFGSTRVSNFVTKILGWILGKIFSFSFESVCVHYGELELVRVAMDSGLPILFVPLNRSHLDPFLISWALLTKGFRPPQFITPHTLMETPVLGRLAKSFGGLGFNQDRVRSDFGYDNQNVNAALLVYMNLLWEKGNSVILPVEPHRSRNGKPSTRLLGREFFTILLNLYEKQQIEDAYVFPVSVNYEILPEQDLITNYQVHMPPKTTFRRWFSRLFGNLGFVRVSFAQPFRLREFKFSRSRVAPANVPKDWNHVPIKESASVVLPGQEFNWVSDFGSVTSVASIYGETDYIQKEWEGIGFEEETALLNHSFFDAARTTVLMSTNLVAFLLLKKFPSGVDFQELVLELDDLAEEVRRIHKQDLGFTGKTSEVVKRAIGLLGPACIHTYKVDGLLMLKPVSKKSSLVKLNYYAGPMMSLYALQGIAAVALFTVLGPSFEAYGDVPFSDPISVQEEVVMIKAVQIAELMKGEFLLHPPCKSMTTLINEAFERMKDYYGELQFDVKNRVYNQIDELLDDYAYDSEDSSPARGTASSFRMIMNNTSEALDSLKFKRGLITPYLEFYSVATQCLKLLIPPPQLSRLDPVTFQGIEDFLLRKSIYAAAEKHFEAGFLRNEELITMDTIRNFLNMMESIGVIGYFAHAETNYQKLYYLTADYEKEIRLDALSGTILGFCT